jgi:hypothetical protein
MSQPLGESPEPVLAEPLEYRGADDSPAKGMPFSLKCGVIGIVLWASIPIWLFGERAVVRAIHPSVFSIAWHVIRWVDFLGPSLVLGATLGYGIAALMRKRAGDQVFWGIVGAAIVALANWIVVIWIRARLLPMAAYFLAIPFVAVIGIFAGIYEIRRRSDRRGETIAGLLLSCVSVLVFGWIGFVAVLYLL